MSWPSTRRLSGTGDRSGRTAQNVRLAVASVRPGPARHARIARTSPAAGALRVRGALHGYACPACAALLVAAVGVGGAFVLDGDFAVFRTGLSRGADAVAARDAVLRAALSGCADSIAAEGGGYPALLDHQLHGRACGLLPCGIGDGDDDVVLAGLHGDAVPRLGAVRLELAVESASEALLEGPCGEPGNPLQ